jgi:hypothetical protein
MEIIDILTPDNDLLPSFTVNIAANFVNVTGIVAPGAKLRSANGIFSRFQRGDNFTILSVGIFIPERFTIWDYPDASGIKRSAPLLQLNGTLGGGLTPIFTFGNIGDMKIPFQNYEFSIGVFNDTEALGLIDASFELSIMYPLIANTLSISMIDVPAIMNGLTFKIVPFFKIVHNFPLF